MKNGKKYWNTDNLSDSTTEEFRYLDFSEMQNKLEEVSKLIKAKLKEIKQR